MDAGSSRYELCPADESLKQNIVCYNSEENIKSMPNAAMRKDQTVAFASRTKWGK